MLTQSFCHVPGLGGHTERALWKAGCTGWDHFLENSDWFSVGSAGQVEVREHLELSKTALENGVHQFFARDLGAKEAWRAFPEFRKKVMYLDIETDGGQYGDSITTIGLYDGNRFTALIKGQDLHEFPDIISNASMIVTFFGSGFDIPMLKKAFPQVPFDQIHLDLCFALKRVGIKGGLKKIERQLGIGRSEDTDGLNGLDAIRLWNAHLRGSESALETLIQYNKEDVVNMEVLAEITYKKLRALTLTEANLTERDLPYNFASIN